MSTSVWQAPIIGARVSCRELPEEKQEYARFGYDLPRLPKAELANICQANDIPFQPNSKKNELLVLVERLYAETRLEEGNADRSFMDPAFDPFTWYTVAMIRQVLTEFNIDFPADARKPELADILDDNLDTIRSSCGEEISPPPPAAPVGLEEHMSELGFGEQGEGTSQSKAECCNCSLHQSPAHWTSLVGDQQRAPVPAPRAGEAHQSTLCPPAHAGPKLKPFLLSAKSAGGPFHTPLRAPPVNRQNVNQPPTNPNASTPPQRQADGYVKTHVREPARRPHRGRNAGTAPPKNTNHQSAEAHRQKSRPSNATYKPEFGIPWEPANNPRNDCCQGRCCGHARTG